VCIDGEEIAKRDKLADIPPDLLLDICDVLVDPPDEPRQ
jgi:hypothetical protein